MKLRVFRSDKGDCLLLTSRDKRRLLVDGGMAVSFSKHVAPALAALKPSRLDAVYVSHIDDDHIGGILQLMDDTVAWRVHDFQRRSGNAGHRPPKAARPPQILNLWHNAFREQLGSNAGPISDMLAQAASTISSAGPNFSALAQHYQDFATSTRQALTLARRAGPDQLGLKVNAPAKGKLMLVRPQTKPFKLGALELTIVGPFEADLKTLRAEWNDWLRENQEALMKLRAQAKRTEADIGNAASPVELEATAAATFAAATAASLDALDLAAPKKLGDRAKVTTPNLASLMLLVQEGTKSVLLTGDGHSDDCYRALKAAKKLDARGNLHLNVLKAFHHGSEHDITQAFCEKVSADHYVFCGNGFSANPEIVVIEAMVKARLAGAGPTKPFKLWFNANPRDRNAKYKHHLQDVERLVKSLAKQARGRMAFEFVGTTASFFDVI